MLQPFRTIAIIALLIVILSTNSVYCVCRQNGIAVQNNHVLAFTSLWTVTSNSLTPGRLQTVESATQSVWDTLTARNNSSNDTAT